MSSNAENKNKFISFISQTSPVNANEKMIFALKRCKVSSSSFQVIPNQKLIVPFNFSSPKTPSLTLYMLIPEIAL